MLGAGTALPAIPDELEVRGPTADRPPHRPGVAGNLTLNGVDLVGTAALGGAVGVVGCWPPPAGPP